MKIATGVAATLGTLLVLAGAEARGPARPGSLPSEARAAARATGEESLPSLPSPPPSVPSEALTQVVQRYCVVCHNDQALTGNLSLARFDVAGAAGSPEVAEKVVAKLRAGMMPPPPFPRPAGDTLQLLARTLEDLLDRAAARSRNPGERTFQRLNRPEYEASVRELLGLDIDAGQYLPLDTRSENFDNIADVQMLSPTLLDAYLTAAADISRLALGNRGAAAREVTYSVSGWASQLERVEGAPFGTRGGISVVHAFPADGEYDFSVTFAATTVGGAFSGRLARFEQVEVSIDGERVALLEIDQWLSIADPDGILMRTEPVFVRAGPRRVTAAFVRRSEGPVEDLVSPHDWSMADRHTALDAYGLTLLPHLEHLVVGGPHRVTGISDNPVRGRVFSCRPTSPSEERPCAERIVTRLGGQAYRRPLTDRDVEGLMAFYDMGAAEGGFESGVRMALQAILASPHFYFRVEETPARVRPGEAYPVPDLALASRLSFFLWGGPPDEELLRLATRRRLSDERELERQVRRMLADPRSAALGTRFAAQWLRLQDLEKVNPDAFWYPDYDQQLADAMRRETELFFHHLVREDRPFLEFFTADYTFLNERLARHYGVSGVSGPEHRRVRLSDEVRRGILGHGSVLVLTSLAGRTSPVLRGKWVMEVLLGTPPPPPPPGVPDLEETEGGREGRILTTRERMEVHRANEACASCHRFMDPIGLALDNFDVTGRWRLREHGMPLDTRGEMYDGTAVESPADLRRALLSRPAPLVRTFTENLMAYAIGRRVEWYDKPAVRAIAREAERDEYRMTSFIMGVVKSDAFRMNRDAEVAAGGPGGR